MCPAKIMRGYSTTDVLQLFSSRPCDHRVDLLRETIGCMLEAKTRPVSCGKEVGVDPVDQAVFKPEPLRFFQRAPGEEVGNATPAHFRPGRSRSQVKSMLRNKHLILFFLLDIEYECHRASRLVILQSHPDHPFLSIRTFSPAFLPVEAILWGDGKPVWGAVQCIDHGIRHASQMFLITFSSPADGHSFGLIHLWNFECPQVEQCIHTFHAKSKRKQSI